MTESLTRVTTGNRQHVVQCPRCRQIVGLWTRLLPPGEYQRLHPSTDITASLLPPERRVEAMTQAADNANKSSLVPWVMCVFCGYDDHYVFGAQE